MSAFLKNLKTTFLLGLCFASILVLFQNCSSSFNAATNLGGSSGSINLVNLNASTISDIQRTASLNTSAALEAKKVGIIYMVWHCAANNPDRNKIIEQALVDKKWGAIPDFHWRSVPKATGSIASYCTQNKSLVQRHFEMLEAAKIDYLVVDFTNQRYLPGSGDGTGQWVAPQSMIDSFQNLLDVSVEHQGKIKIVPWVDFHGDLLPELVRRLNRSPAAQFQFEGKPLLIASWDKGRGQHLAQPIVDSYRAQGFSVRKMWGLGNGAFESDVWSFMEKCQSNFLRNQGNVPCDQFVHKEMASVSAAYQETVMTDFSTSVSKLYGRTFLRQLETAQKSGAGLILINSWNEWIAQRFCRNFVDGEVKITHECYKDGSVDKPVGEHFPYESRPIFVDMFNSEYSRDFEPDTKSDQYYQLLATSIAALKGVANQGGNSTRNPSSLPLDGGWSDWKATSSCSKVCGGGKLTETRTCTAPAPANNGKDCSGERTREVDCNMQACEVAVSNKVLGHLDSISLITADSLLRLKGWACVEKNDKPVLIHVYSDGPAGSGKFVRAGLANLQRETQVKETCKTTQSSHGFDFVLSADESKVMYGKKIFAYGISSENAQVTGELSGIGFTVPVVGNKDKPAPVDGGWSPWQISSVCNKICGGGIQREVRTCTAPAPANQGKDCVGEGSREVACNTQACEPVGSGKVLGALDFVALTSDNRIRLLGWTCSEGIESAIAFHVYASGPAGSGIIVKSEVANLPREAAVKSLCKTNSEMHGFDVTLSDRESVLLSGNKVYVHGISANPNTENLILSGSGVFAPNLGSSNSGGESSTDNRYSEVQSLNVGANAGPGRTGTWWCTQHFGSNLGGTWECLGYKCDQDVPVNQSVECGKKK